MLNINGSTDPSYRYKMPRVVGKVEGRGNGIKTVIVNCREVAASLKRPTEQLTKFIGLQMGASSRIDHDKSIVNGAIETQELQKLVTLYIEKFVLCPKCGNPETVQKLNSVAGSSKKSQGLVVLKCKACGETTEVDNSHRLITQILKEIAESTSKESSNDAKDSKKSSKEKDVPGVKNNADAQSEAAAAAEQGKSSEKSSEKKEKKPKKESKKESKKSSSKDKADPEAFKQAMERLSTGLDSALLDGQELDGDSALDLATNLLNEFGLVDKRDLMPLVWSACVASRPAKASASVEKFKLVLGAAAREGKKNPARLLSSAASYAGEDEKIIKTIPLAIKALFDCDVVSDDDVLAWFEKASLDIRVKKQLGPLIEWLQAEDDEDDSDDSDGSGSESEEEEKPTKKRSSSSTDDNSNSEEEED
ncbi:hypothetical protein BASA81_004413 [Batrachochytrium salamandrivorans]|nr:hypothetical protein BASA81_004413 [Batrachochytrium salamandrivorans]